jgi:hypothetical protein
MSDKIMIPPEIDGCEPLLRAVSHPSGLDNNKRATPLAFRLRKGEQDISLCRGWYEDFKAFTKRALKFKYYWPGDKTAAVAELYASDIRSLDMNIILKPSTDRSGSAHASIYFKNEDGSFYIGKEDKETDPVDPKILSYEMALASIVKKVYDLEKMVIWEQNQDVSVIDD